MGTAIKLFIWFILTILVIDLAFELMSMKDTLLNISGVTLAFVYVLVTIKTKCLTILTFKRNEKN